MPKANRNPHPLHLERIVKNVATEFQTSPIHANIPQIELEYSNNLPITYLDELLVTASLESILLLACTAADRCSMVQINIQAIPNEILIRFIQFNATKSNLIIDDQKYTSNHSPNLHEINTILLRQASQLAAHSGGKLVYCTNDHHETTYVYTLPILNTSSQLANEMPSLYLKRKNSSASNGVPEPKHKLLIIDEHYDQSIELYNKLIVEFEVFVARNIKEGVEKTRKHLPNLIIIGHIESVSTPSYIFNFLSEDAKANHIPIIRLLSTEEEPHHISALDAHFTGSKNMADSVLLQLVSSILKLSEQIKRHLLEYLARQGRVSFQESIDYLLRIEESSFLKKIQHLIEEHHTEENLNVERLAELSFMSKSRLQRKTMALAGETVSAMIRTFRLRKARHLLVTMPEDSIYSISANCGFSDPNYFSTVFSRQYGLSPMRYRQQYFFNKL
jgi:AraC-like DNA-binding protein